MRLLLVRHGESEGNASGVLQGRLDYGLTRLGQRQAEATARALGERKIDRIISSPLSRAKLTATRVAEVSGAQLELDERLAEYDIGAIGGLTGPQVREKFPELVAAMARGERWEAPGEEGREPFRERVAGFLEGLRGTKETTVAVAHGGVIGVALYIILGMDYSRRGAFRVANCAISEVVEDRSGRLVLVRHNDICHLEGVTATDDEHDAQFVQGDAQALRA
jgi:broad specificity phosphatase PhoE